VLGDETLAPFFPEDLLRDTVEAVMSPTRRLLPGLVSGWPVDRLLAIPSPPLVGLPRFGIGRTGPPHHRPWRLRGTGLAAG
jgi:hypothetical protein